MDSITIKCNRCGETTTGPYYVKRYKFYRCGACGKAMRLGEYPQKDGPTLLVPTKTGAQRQDPRYVKRVRSIRLSDFDLEEIEAGRKALTARNKRITLAV